MRWALRCAMLNGMADFKHPKITPETAGLCADCGNARLVQSKRGSVFLLCELSQKNPQFSKYPRFPVVACAGYDKSPTGAKAPRP